MKMQKIIFLLLITIPNLFAEEIYDAGFTAPSRPILYATVNEGRVYLYWDASAEASVDSLTGYADFEGYKIYKSVDGGQTWGMPEDRLYDYDGNFAGWKALAQFDLSLIEDQTHCIYEKGLCNNDDVRGIDVSGYDPLAERSYLGSNSGLAYTYVDSDVVDGIEYTYCITSYDMGLRTYKTYYTFNDSDSTYHDSIVWSPSNPDHFTALDGGGFRSLECPKGSGAVDVNFLTIISGVHASNITFPDPNNTSEFLIPNPGTIGNGQIQYAIVNESELTDGFLKLEVNATMADNSFEGFASENPLIYVYAVSDTQNQTPLNSVAHDTVGLSLDSLAALLEMPGAVLTSSAVEIPEYLITAPMNEWSDFLDGIRFNFENLPDQMPVEGSGFQTISSLDWSADTLARVATFFTLNYKSSAIYSQHPNYDYKIEFGTGPKDTVAGTSPASACSDLPTKTILPFRITNLTTGKKVMLRHVDKGVTNDGSDTNPVEGYKDCRWTRNEQLIFYGDSVHIGTDTTLVRKQTFDLYINIDIIAQGIAIAAETGETNIPVWLPGTPYSAGSYVYSEGMIFKASQDINDYIEPIEWVDYNGDDINDNPWVTQYPWKDGDYVILHPKKTFVDGDSWVADLSKLGASHPVTQEEMHEVTVVPNPYIVHSQFNETPSRRRLRFTNLPQDCRITIFTITGEVVNKLNHANEYDGNEWWDLTSANGQVVAPGLYYYLVESDSKNFIGKFAVVR